MTRRLAVDARLGWNAGENAKANVECEPITHRSMHRRLHCCCITSVQTLFLFKNKYRIFPHLGLDCGISNKDGVKFHMIGNLSMLNSVVIGKSFRMSNLRLSDVDSDPFIMILARLGHVAFRQVTEFWLIIVLCWAQCFVLKLLLGSPTNTILCRFIIPPIQRWKTTIR